MDLTEESSAAEFSDLMELHPILIDLDPFDPKQVAGGEVTVVHFVRSDVMVLGMKDWRLVVHDFTSGKTEDLGKVCDGTIWSISSNDNFFAVGSWDVSVWNSATMELVKVIGANEAEVGCVRLNREFLVSISKKKLVVSSAATTDWAKVATVKRNKYRVSPDGAHLSDDNVLTVVGGYKIKQFRLTVDNCTRIRRMTVAGRHLHSITAVVGSSPSEFWVGASRGFLLKLNLDTKSVSLRVRVGSSSSWNLQFTQLKCFNEFLLGRTSDGRLLAFETEKLSREASRGRVRFRESFVTSNVEVRGNKWAVGYHEGKMVARCVADIRAMEKKEKKAAKRRF